ncbi:MAG: amino acid--tRNA ligase-related protein, partial [bacterium]|nr:amino acid--tRNA ligase-related protein [bacterium]
KRLLVGGFEKVFEIGKVFRNEGVDRDHNPEFTMLELYWAYQNYEGLMKFVEKMLKRYLPGKWERISFAELFRAHAGKEWYEVPPAELDDIYKRKIRLAGKIEHTTFVTDYPERLMALAKFGRDDNANDPLRRLTESFQLIPGSGDAGAKGGSELVKGYSEMNDPALQRKQMEEQESRFRNGDEEETRLDQDFLEALEYGMPPAAGMGLGIDRLVLIAVRNRFKEKFGREPEEINNVRDVIAFPTLRQKD